MNKKFTVIFIFYIILGSIVAQNDSLNREKYWHFRHRLITKFVKPGLGPGESIPANKYSVYVSWYKKPVGPYKKIEWGDATIHLGWYIGVLATEIELLQRSNKTNDRHFEKLIQELYFALNAINRLDDNAEIIWGYAPDDCTTRIDKIEPVKWDSRNRRWLPKPGSGDKPIRNGFILRNDGNQDLLNYFTDASSILTEVVRPWVWDDTLSLEKSGNNFSSFGHFTADPYAPNFEYRANGFYSHNELSQDQLFHLLMGIMLVAEFVEEDINYKGIPLNTMAKEIGLRMINFYKGMEIRNPVYPKRSVCSAGGNSFAFWQSIMKVKMYLKTGKKNNFKDQILLWGKNSCETSYMVNRALFVIIASIANSTPQQDICRYSTTDGFSWGIFYLIRRAIYNPKISPNGCTYTSEQVKYELNVCPFRGPHFDAMEYGPGGDYLIPKTKEGVNFREYTRQQMVDSMIPVWHQTNRFLHQCMPTSGSAKRFVAFPGEFNALDYMLLYNIANIVFGIDVFGGDYAASREHYFNEQEMIIK